jgi:excisionase family DNA binding protein
MPEQKPLLSAKDAANLLGVSIYTLYGWTSAKKIPTRKAGSLLRFDENELRDWTINGAATVEKTLDRSPKNDQRLGGKL